MTDKWAIIVIIAGLVLAAVILGVGQGLRYSCTCKGNLSVINCGCRCENCKNKRQNEKHNSCECKSLDTCKSPADSATTLLGLIIAFICFIALAIFFLCRLEYTHSLKPASIMSKTP